MDERLSTPSGFNDRPPHEAKLPMTDDQKRDFAKRVEYWSNERDSAEASEAKTSDYMAEFAPHRAVTRVVKTRSRSQNGVRYERDGVTVLCKSADDFSSLRVNRRVPTDEYGIDKVTRTEYAIDGPHQEVVELEWLVYRESGERVVRQTKDELVDELASMFSYEDSLEDDAGASVDIVLPTEPEDETIFTQGRAWETEDIFAALAEEGWARSLPN